MQLLQILGRSFGGSELRRCILKGSNVVPLVLTYFLYRDFDILPPKELHWSPWVVYEFYSRGIHVWQVLSYQDGLLDLTGPITGLLLGPNMDFYSPIGV